MDRLSSPSVAVARPSDVEPPELEPAAVEPAAVEQRRRFVELGLLMCGCVGSWMFWGGLFSRALVVTCLQAAAFTGLLFGALGLRASGGLSKRLAAFLGAWSCALAFGAIAFATAPALFAEFPMKFGEIFEPWFCSDADQCGFGIFMELLTAPLRLLGLLFWVFGTAVLWVGKIVALLMSGLCVLAFVYGLVQLVRGLRERRALAIGQDAIPDQ